MRLVSLSTASSLLVAVSTASSLLATACTDDDEFPPPPPTRVMEIASLPLAKAEVSIERRTGTSLILSVFLDYDGDKYTSDNGLIDRDGRFCPTMSADFRIALDGVSLSSSPGEWQPNGLDERYYCWHPRARLEVPPEGQTAGRVVTISDASRTITFPLGDMLVPR